MNNRKSLFVDANETYDDCGLLPAGEIIGLNESDTVVGTDNVPAISYAESKDLKSVGGKMVANSLIRNGYTGEPLGKCADKEMGRVAQLGLGVLVIKVVAEIFGIKK